MDSYPSRLVLSAALWEQMQAHAQACLPEEACGLLGGLPAAPNEPAAAVLVLPVENALHSRVRYRMEPSAQLQAFYTLEEQGLELLAVFHSHPRGPEHPSPTDLAEFAYPGVLTVILCPRSDSTWQARAYAIHGTYSKVSGFSEIPVVISPQPGSA